MFGRATITLGIGPHSSIKYFVQENLWTKRALPRTLNTAGQFLNCPAGESWTSGTHRSICQYLDNLS